MPRVAFAFTEAPISNGATGPGAVFMDSKVVFGDCAKGRYSARKLNAVLRKNAAECIGSGYTLDLVWVSTWANPGDLLSRAAWKIELPMLLETGQIKTASGAASCEMYARCFARHLAWEGRGLLRRSLI